MATVQRDLVIAQQSSVIWDAVRDVGAIHRRLVPGFVVQCTLDGYNALLTPQAWNACIDGYTKP